jgi:hypothetical protein
LDAIDVPHGRDADVLPGIGRVPVELLLGVDDDEERPSAAVGIGDAARH